MKPMTPAEARVFAVVRTYITRTGCSPSFQEIAQRCGLRSMATVHAHVRALAQKGQVVRDSSHRGLSLPAPWQPTPRPYRRSTVDNHLGAIDA